MRSYPVLRTIASIIKVLAVIGGILGILVALFSLREGFLVFLLTAFGTGLGVLLQWAAAEIILLFVDSADNVAAIRAHLLDEGRSAASAPQASAGLGTSNPGASPAI